MMKHLVFVLVILFSISSCHQTEKLEKPIDLISESKMVNIIFDMSLLTASRGVDKNALEDNCVSLESLIYNKYNIDSLMFAESSEYYAHNIEEYEALYIKVNDSLTQLKEIFNIEIEKEEDEKRKRDSIKKLLKLKIKDQKIKGAKKKKTDSLPFLPKNN